MPGCAMWCSQWVLLHVMWNRSRRSPANSASSNTHTQRVGCCAVPAAAGAKKEAAKKPAADSSKKSDLLEDTLKCVICFNLCERPVTVSNTAAPCAAPASGMPEPTAAEHSSKALATPAATPAPNKRPAPASVRLPHTPN
jgi:hypothetical protein